MDSREGRWLKRGICIGLVIVFCLCVFILAAQRYGFLGGMAQAGSERREILEAAGPESEWAYMDGGEEPGVGNVWTTDRYDTSRWKEGRGVFAAPESAGAGGAGVVLQAETPEHGEAGTYFFRKEFEVDGIDEILSMEGQIRYSDAVIVYLNGEIIFAGNVPAGGYESNQETGTAQASEGVQESYFQVTDLSALRAGRNILAVEVHQEDMEQDDAYFSFQGFRLLGIELEEDEPDIQGLMLEQGENEEQICVSWITDSDSFYQVEYMTKSDYTSWNKEFSEVSSSVLMGRKYLPESGKYLNHAVLKRLQVGTEYLYRVVRVGGVRGCELMSFTTAVNNKYSFGLVGGFSAEGSQAWEQSAEAWEELLGTCDFLLYPGAGTEAGENLAFRRPWIFKKIPVGITKSAGEGGTGDYSFTYQDSLFLMLDSDSGDMAAHRAFIENAAANARRKWIFAVMRHGAGELEEGQRREYEAMFEESGVDVVICGQSGGTIVGGNLEEGPVYLAAGRADGPAAAEVTVDERQIRIKVYELASGEELASYSVSFNSK